MKLTNIYYAPNTGDTRTLQLIFNNTLYAMAYNYRPITTIYELFKGCGSLDSKMKPLSKDNPWILK